ncbi:MAG: replicative DNA helicase [Paracholeplasma sp.]|uniref:Replicative DNA helicase n=1 Tax=Acholeplasma brassicae TaxID=61635 RepID=U4KML1_9MOLU|nr:MULTISPECIES: replicative DNA helicase [Paracholeplasma]MDY3195603.1 replicative DNA helicase [Paracholeplasma sp.]CCV65341.1 Replicative DNA helicase [Paracholeplasma brassicae]
MSRVMPFNLEAEQSVLGAAFLNPNVLIAIIDKLNQEDFFDQRNQKIYEAMRQIFQRSEKIDYTTVSTELAQMGAMKSIGVAYLSELTDFVPTTANLDAYIDIVRDYSLKRMVIETAGKILEDGYNEGIRATEYIDDAEEKIFDLVRRRKATEFLKIDKVVQEVREKAESRKHQGAITGLKTGFAILDNLTAGFQPEELLILAARPSMGKSAFAMNLALNAAKFNHGGKAGVAVFSLEMSNEQLVGRMLSSEARVENKKIKTGELTSKDWQFIDTASLSLANLNIFFDDSSAVTVQEIRSKCRKLKQEGRLDFVVIDYLQLIKGDERGGSNRQEEVAKISRSLKQMARELKIPVMALSQLSRGVEKRDDKRPVLADLRESGSIEQDADIVMFLYRGEYYSHGQEDNGETEVSIAKNRQGSVGNVLNFIFEKQYSRFIPIAERDDEPQN